MNSLSVHSTISGERSETRGSAQHGVDEVTHVLGLPGIERERIWALVDIISTGQMPAGHTAEDLRAMGLPQPGELYREEQPDGTILIRQVAPSELEKPDPKNKFVCDAPE